MMDYVKNHPYLTTFAFIVGALTGGFLPAASATLALTTLSLASMITIQIAVGLVTIGMVLGGSYAFHHLGEWLFPTPKASEAPADETSTPLMNPLISDSATPTPDGFFLENEGIAESTPMPNEYSETYAALIDQFKSVLPREIVLKHDRAVDAPEPIIESPPHPNPLYEELDEQLKKVSLVHLAVRTQPSGESPMAHVFG